MNERIQQLCRQKADYWMNHYDRKSLADMSLLYNDIERFAELIVRECANVIHDRIGPKSALDVLEHFGVE